MGHEGRLRFEEVKGCARGPEWFRSYVEALVCCHYSWEHNIPTGIVECARQEGTFAAIARECHVAADARQR